MHNPPLQRFIETSWDRLAWLENRIRSLQEHPEDAELPAEIGETLAALQESAGFLGLTRLASWAGLTNKVVETLHRGGLSASSEAVSRLNEAVGSIRKLLEGLEATGEERAADHADLISELNRLLAEAADVAPRIEPFPPPFSGQPIPARRILVVDDSLYGRHWTAAALEAENFEVVLADGLHAASTLLEPGDRFDLIIARPDLPGSYGRFPQKLRDEFGLNDIPMIALIENRSTHQTRAHDADIAGRVERFNRIQLLETVRNLCPGRPETVRIPA